MALRSVTGGWGGVDISVNVTPAFILPAHLILPYRFSRVDLPFEFKPIDIILSAFR